MNLRLADVSKRYGAGAAVDRVVPAPREEGERLRRTSELIPSGNSILVHK